MSYQRSYPAGPYAQVQTSYGGLVTSIPIVSLGGLGDSSLDFSLTHRSNVASPGTFGLTIGRPGLGWFHSFEMVCVADGNTASNVTCSVGGNQWGEWYRQTEPTANIMLRRPGTRGDLQRLITGGDTTAGFIVTNQADKSKWHFTKVLSAQTQFLIEKIVDRFGNQTDFYYVNVNGSVPRLWMIEDPTNTRKIQLEYGNDNPMSGTAFNTISSIKFLINDVQVREWLLKTGSTNPNDPWSEYLGQIRFPDPVTGNTSLTTSPYIGFNYDSTDSNIIDIYDLMGERFNYTYANSSQIGLGQRHVWQIRRPNADPLTVGQIDSHPTNITFTAVTQAGGPFEQICTIEEPTGDALNPAVPRIRRHVYNTDTFLETNYFKSPIKRIEDPTDNGQTYAEQFEWDWSQAMLKKYYDRRLKMWEFGNDGQHRGLTYWVKDPDLKLSEFFYHNDLLMEEWLPIDTSANTFSITKYTYHATNFSLLTKLEDATSNSFINLVTHPNGISNPNGLSVLTTNTYTPTGQLETTKIGTENRTTHSNFDIYGNAQTTTLPGGGVITRTIDSLNQVTHETLPLHSIGENRTTIFEYDKWGRKKKVKFPGSVAMERNMTYDLNGNLLTDQDENGWTTTTTYDNLNRVLTVKRPVDATPSNDLITSTAYYFEGNVKTITDPKGNVTLHEYSPRDLLLRIRYPDITTGWSQQMTYDGNGSQLSRTDGMGKVTNYTYDNQSRLWTVTYPATFITNAVRSIIYLYFDNGVRKSMNYNIDGTPFIDTYTVNTAGIADSHLQAISGKTTSSTFFTGNGRRQTLSVKTGTVNAMTWTYGYETSGRLQTINQSNGQSLLASFSYYPDDSIQEMWPGTLQQSNTVGTRYFYDPRGRTTGVSYNHYFHGGFGYGWGFGYDYDKVGNVTNYTLSHNFTQTFTWPTTYTYDRANRLMTETRVGVDPDSDGIKDGNKFENTYSYDKNGNRTSVVRNGTPSTYLPYSSTFDDDRFGSGDGYSVPGYNGNGSPTSLTTPNGYNISSITYDYDDHPVRIQKSNGSISDFRYDGDGKRVQSVSSSVTRRVIYDGDTIVAESDGSGNFTQFFVPSIGYVKVLGPAYEQHFYYQNALGSSVVDTGGAALAVNEYDGFGLEYPVLWYVQGPTNQFRFAGKHGYQRNDDIGMDLLGARFYIPKLGRFLTRDPIGHAGGLNLYAYCNNNPMNSVDPDGSQERGVGEPGFWEGLIPFWGSGRQATNDFQNGRWGWGIVNSAVAISDVIVVGIIVKAVAKTGVKATISIGSSSWRSARTLYKEVGLADFAGQHFHHLLKQKYYLNSTAMKTIMNQSFMVTKLRQGYNWKGVNFSMNGWHQLLDGKTVSGMKMSDLERIWYGSNNFQKAGATSAVGATIRAGN